MSKMDFWKFQPRKRVKWLCQERRLGHAPGEARKRPKCCPGGTKMRPRGAKTGSRAAQKHQDEKKTFFVGFWRRPRRPRVAPRAPKSAQERPRGAQERPKRVPRGSPEEPERVQEGSEVRRKRHSSETSKKPTFFQLSPLAGRLQQGHEKSRKIVENRARGVQKSIKVDKLRARRARRAPRGPKKLPRQAKKRKKIAQDRPKSAQVGSDGRSAGLTCP